MSSEVLQAALRERLGQQRQEQIMVMGFAQEYEARGEARGLAKGRAEGEAKGEAKALLRLLEKRFGATAVTAEFRERVLAANVAALDAWLDRAIEADNLSAVFDSPV